MSNGFDPYDGQMIIMPYGGSPFSINPSEYCNGESTAPYPQNHYQKRNSVDSEVKTKIKRSMNENLLTKRKISRILLNRQARRMRALALVRVVRQQLMILAMNHRKMVMHRLNRRVKVMVRNWMER